MTQGDLRIFYTSGTGNTFRITQWIGDQAHELGWDAERISIEDKAARSHDFRLKRPTLIFAMPTHGFTTPWHMLRFALKLPQGQQIPTYCLATRAGMRIGPYICNGIAGTCTFLMALVLLIKGYRVLGTVHVNMPSNWYSLHPMQAPKTVSLLLEQSLHQVRTFAKRVLMHKRIWRTPNNLYEVLWGLLLLPISVIYLILGRFGLAKLFFANGKCDGCGLCAKGCPVSAISMRGKNHTRPFWKYNCESCMRCAAFCPKNAIEASHSWFAIITYITSIPAWAYLLIWLGDQYPVVQELEYSWLGPLLRALYLYMVFIVPYRLFHLALRIPVVNWFFTHTTFTHYWSRYKEPSVKFKDLRPRQ